jgi:hypothetical protein
MKPRAGGGTAFQYVLLACCLAAAAPVGLFAQGTDNVRTYWVRARQFKIPFSFDYDPRVTAAVLLHVSENGRDYRDAGTANPSDRHFLFRTDHDGVYSFIVQTRDRAGVLAPPDFRDVPPSVRIRVHVDTQKPVIRLEAAKKEGWPAAIHWEIEDENFDDVRADYRSVNGGEWYPLLVPREAKQVFGWVPAIGGKLEVRLQARDKAGNVAEPCLVTVEPDPQSAKNPPPTEGGGGKDGSEVKYVRSKKFQLEYEVDKDSKGPSGVKSVDIWKMREGGPWQKCHEAGTPDGPVMVTVESAGRWGFRLIPRSGVGLAEPDPRPGDRPDLWVEVDEQAPRVEINRLLVGRGTEHAGKLTVSWTASDKFLAARPITISYRSGEQGEWTEVARDLPNTGSYTFKPLDRDPHLYQLYIRVTAIDEAGNKGEAESKEPVKVDLKVPRIKQIKVGSSTGDPQSRGPSTAPSQNMLLPGSPSSPPPALPTDFSSPGRDQRKP